MLFIPRRLDKYLRESTRLSAVQARLALAAGRVRVRSPAGEASTGAAPDRLVFAEDFVTLDGAHVTPRRDHHYVMLNKPAGVTSTTASPVRERDLTEFLRDMPDAIFPVGRLDRDTTGLLLFTTDGDLAASILRPDHSTEKEYWLWLADEFDDVDPRLATLLDGIPTPGGLARAIDVCLQARNAAGTQLRLILHSGMHRQIRRMCFALGWKLLHLHRLRIGSLELEDLPVGAWRSLTPLEVDRLWDVVGGRHYVVARRIAALERGARRSRDRGVPLPRLEAWLASRDARSKSTSRLG